ncbi:MAG TPA: hypothetical protein PLQ56_08010 [Aggregatilineales bacterium]|nr:hypothetical protein [Aggregatilineales bacterium]
MMQPKWITNPIYRADTLYLRRARSIDWYYIVRRVLLFIPVALVACIPSIIYIDGFQDNWLHLMLLTTILVHVVLTVRVAAVTVNLIQQSHQNGTWDLIRLTGITARWLVMGKWLAAFREVAFDFALFSIIKLGLSVAFVHYLNVPYSSVDWRQGGYFGHYVGICPEGWPYGFISPFCYMGLVGLPHIPALPQLLVALVITCVTALLETGLLVAMTTWITIRFGLSDYSKNDESVPMPTSVQVLMVCGFRFGLAICVFAGVLLIDGRSGAWLPGANYVGEDFFTLLRRIWDTAHLAFSSLLDNAILLNANIMREKGALDLLPLFHLRNIFAAGLGMLLYLALIRYFLARAQVAAIRRHGLPGVIEV